MKYYFNINLNFLLVYYFKNIIKKKKISTWHFHSVNYKTLIYIEVLKKLNQKIIVTLQGADIQIDYNIGYGYRLDKKYDKFLSEVFKKVDLFHAISENIFQELLNLGIKKNLILKIPNCSPQKKFQQFTKVNNKTFTLLTIGRFAVKKKGFDLVEKVARQLDKIMNYKWIIIGRDTKKLLDNDYFKHNQNKFEILDQIENNNEIYFPNSRLVEYYKKSDLYVNLARVEGSPLVILDAISSNLPIISFNTPGGDELVINGVNGYIVNELNCEIFAKKVKNLINFRIDHENPKFIDLKTFFDLDHNIKKIIESYNL